MCVCVCVCVCVCAFLEIPDTVWNVKILLPMGMDDSQVQGLLTCEPKAKMYGAEHLSEDKIPFEANEKNGWSFPPHSLSSQLKFAVFRKSSAGIMCFGTVFFFLGFFTFFKKKKTEAFH